MPDLLTVQTCCRESLEREGHWEMDVVRGNCHQQVSSCPPWKYFNPYLHTSVPTVKEEELRCSYKDITRSTALPITKECLHKFVLDLPPCLGCFVFQQIKTMISGEIGGLTKSNICTFSLMSEQYAGIMVRNNIGVNSWFKGGLWIGVLRRTVLILRQSPIMQIIKQDNFESLY